MGSSARFLATAPSTKPSGPLFLPPDSSASERVESMEVDLTPSPRRKPCLNYSSTDTSQVRGHCACGSQMRAGVRREYQRNRPGRGRFWRPGAEGTPRNRMSGRHTITNAYTPDSRAKAANGKKSRPSSLGSSVLSPQRWKAVREAGTKKTRDTQGKSKVDTLT
ncbi:hypothetical protein E2I00_008829 [Balaenoptera physalus]|uniref:Uncharacterized protein n=1 Tax=Balaenoptera physalus TaxID=9770 RepID=A0A643CDG3_BALPH|nr:hypothetical protein E2I00_008829 [Balaenoptera physalus]